MTDDYTYLSKKKFKGVTYDWDYLSNYGDGQKLYCLTDFQVGWLLSTTVYMSWLTRWENCPCSKQDLDAMKAELDLALMTCIDIQPWMLDFNYNQAVGEALNGYNEAYATGGIPGLNPETPVDFFNGDGSVDRDTALCTALNIYVRSYAQNWMFKAQSVLGAIFVVGVIASLTLVGGIITGVVLAGLKLVTEVALDAMQDETALDNIVCCMLSALTDKVVSDVNFETALDNCNFQVGSNEAIIRDIIASDLDQWGNYLSFLNSLGDAYTLSQAGVTVCPCTFPMDDFTITWDALSGVGWSVQDFFPSPYSVTNPQIKQDNTRGLPIPACKGAYVLNTASLAKGTFVGLEVDLIESQTVVGVEFDFYWLRTVNANNNFDIIITMFDSLGNQVFYNHGSQNGAIKNAWVHWSLGVVNIDNVKTIHVRASRDDGASNATNSIAWVDNIAFSFS